MQLRPSALPEKRWKPAIDTSIAPSDTGTSARSAKRHHVSYSFLFMRADGDQLGRIAALIEAGAIKPVIDRVFPFESTGEALAYVETGRTKGKVVIKIQ